MSTAVTITLIICGTIILLSICGLIRAWVDKDTMRDMIREELENIIIEALEDYDEQ